MLRKIRIALAALFLIGITLLFVGTGHEWWGWMAKLQFLPSCLALNFGVIVGILLLTFVFGRIYCSVICPLGVFQDLVNSIRMKVAPRKVSFRKENVIVRLIVLGASIGSIVTGTQVFILLIAPYSAYGRIVRSFVSTLTGGPVVLPLVLVGCVTLVVVGVCAWIWGREYCNTICPVGTVLSLVSRFSLFKPVIDRSMCVSCGKCEKSCKAACIDSKNKNIDYSRCVDCFDCMSNCKLGGLKYKFAPGRVAKAEAPAKAEAAADKGRRAFIASIGMIGASAISAKAQNMKVDGGLAEVKDKVNPERSERLVPFGAGSVKNFYDKCTACQLCVSACPNGVLRPSTDLEHLLQPVMGYEKGYCRPECTKCSEVCPAGAIKPLAKGEKLTTHIGVAKVNLNLCVTRTDGVACGNCSRHCPVGAIVMVKDPEGKFMVPSVAEELCIGCGACENLCPSRPISAITVNGLTVHRNG